MPGYIPGLHMTYPSNSEYRKINTLVANTIIYIISSYSTSVPEKVGINQKSIKQK
jgi:hypothetical protein